jgi:hypothetical protein
MRCRDTVGALICRRSGVIKLWTRVRRAGHDGAVSYETGRATDAEASHVATRDDLARFLSAVIADFRSAGAVEWENGTLERFLDGLAAVAGSRVGGTAAVDQEVASWRLFAEIVRAATGYE